MILAKLKIKEDKVAECLEIADKTYKAVRAEELGMRIIFLIQILIILFVS